MVEKEELTLAFTLAFMLAFLVLPAEGGTVIREGLGYRDELHDGCNSRALTPTADLCYCRFHNQIPNTTIARMMERNAQVSGSSPAETPYLLTGKNFIAVAQLSIYARNPDIHK